MNRFITTILLLCFGMLFTTSCRKGEQDPFLSLRSRKARLEGEWKVASYGVRDDFKMQGDTSAAGLTHDGKYVSLIFSEGIYGIDVFGNVNWHYYTFNKDGTYSCEFNYTMIFYDAFISAKQEFNFIEKEEGTWQFMGAGQDIKDKECVVLEPLKADNIYKKNGNLMEEKYINRTGTNKLKKYRIEMLTNKEVRLKSEYKVNSTYAYITSNEIKVGQTGSQSMSLVRE